jgi:hypothetical protein
VADQRIARRENDDGESSALVAATRVLQNDAGQPTIVRRAPLMVGAANDVHERRADLIADNVVRALAATPPGASGDGEPPVARRAQRGHAPTSTAVSRRATGARVQRSAIGLEGGQLDQATSDTIERRRGGGIPLQGRVRRRMEQGFGTDLGAVRLHAGTEASTLNESMSAQAFTVGNDVFLHRSTPDLSSPAGERLLAHEIAHTFQQTGTGQRSTVRRKMMSVEKFNEVTNEGVFVRSSKAQKSIRVLLEAYHKTYPWEKQLTLDASSAGTAIEKLEEIRRVANMWITDHTATETQNPGTTMGPTGPGVIDPKRLKRRAGMMELITACENEMRTMRDLIQVKSTGSVTGSNQDISNIVVQQESEEFSKVKEKYSGDAVSGFRRLGFLIDGAVPVVGDKASISLEITIPIPPGFISLEFSAESERSGPAAPKTTPGTTTGTPTAKDDKSRVETALNVGVGGGASVGSIAKLKAGIGCYLKAKGRTGADVAELMSYALYRRCQESVLVPREITSTMWGGGRSGEYGWIKAENWSRGVETRIFGDDEEAEVSSGVYGKVAAEIELSKDLASLGLEVKGTKGTTINKDSIEKAKGGVGKKNQTRAGTEIATGGGVRGTAQKSLGVQNLGLETSAKFAFGILSGGLTGTFGWSRNGPASLKNNQPTFMFDTFEISANLAGQMPFNKMAGDAIAALIPNFVATVNKLIRGSTQAAKAETKARAAGAIAEDVGSYGAQIAELVNVPKEAWQPFAANPATAGMEVGSTVSLELSGKFDFMKKELTLELRLGKSSALTNAIKAGGDVVQVFKLDITKSSRLLQLTYGSSGWAVS